VRRFIFSGFWGSGGTGGSLIWRGFGRVWSGGGCVVGVIGRGDPATNRGVVFRLFLYGCESIVRIAVDGDEDDDDNVRVVVCHDNAWSFERNAATCDRDRN